MLYHLSFSHFGGVFDVGIGNLCKHGREGEVDFSCIAVYPGLIHGTFGENDIQDLTIARKEREKEKVTPSGPNLVFGVRANVKNLIEGKELVGRWQGEEEIGQVEMWYDEGKSERSKLGKIPTT